MMKTESGQWLVEEPVKRSWLENVPSCINLVFSAIQPPVFLVDIFNQPHEAEIFSVIHERT
jgi:hypothetical protein